MRKNTIVPKKPSATDAKLRASSSPGEEAILSPIQEENKEDDFSQLPEVQGSSVAQGLTGDGQMEPLSEQQKEFLQPCIADTRNRLEAEQREERKFYDEEMARMREQMNEMREDYNDLRRSRSSPVAEITTRKHAFETPKVQRPQDIAYQEILSASKTQFQPPPDNTQQ
jgi:hypothetical protein